MYDFSQGLPTYWAEDHKLQLDAAETFHDIGALMLDVMRIMHASENQAITEVCGPISTGGRGSVIENLKVFSKTIQHLKHHHGHLIFDQMPFEEAIGRVSNATPLPEGAGTYHMGILDHCYLPLFESGMVKKFFFLPDWESSFGARWEHDVAQRLNIDIEYLPGHWYELLEESQKKE
jgi:hypothetical protein